MAQLVGPTVWDPQSCREAGPHYERRSVRTPAGRGTKSQMCTSYNVRGLRYPDKPNIDNAAVSQNPCARMYVLGRLSDIVCLFACLYAQYGYSSCPVIGVAAGEGTTADRVGPVCVAAVAHGVAAECAQLLRVV